MLETKRTRLTCTHPRPTTALGCAVLDVVVIQDDDDDDEDEDEEKEEEEEEEEEEEGKMW